MKKTRILIGSSICQTPKILERFLDSLQKVNLSGADATFRFIDDNQIQESKDILSKMELGYKTDIINAPPRETAYHVNETTHYWNNSLVLRVAALKNEIITHAIENNYDYLFLIDSDLIIDSSLIEHLVAQEKDIISEIFWTSWQPGTIPLPNVWMYDKYEMAHPELDVDTRKLQTSEFLDKLRKPGVYEVGGLGACTLIAASALKKGLNFSPIKNVSLWGEDRWFCIRATVLGFDLFVDTHFPAKHLYRESDL